MAERAAMIEAFLSRHGWGEAARTPLAGDASFRRYERLEQGDARAVLMDAPPPKEDVRPFVAIARFLASLDYSAPAILAADEGAGLLLLEDLGDALYTQILASAGASGEMTLYGAAIALLADLHRQPPPPQMAPYDEAALLEEADLLVDWYIPHQRGAGPDAGLRAEYKALWREILPQSEIGDPVLVLRDYHADNLLWLPERAGLAKVGLLDFQDALMGSAAYDLVSLLEDARRDVAPATVEAGIAAYLGLRPEIDAATFRTAYAILGSQRNCKIVGIFTRLWVRDAKPAYLDYLPRVWRLLEDDLAHPVMVNLRDWIEREIPPVLRERRV